MKKFRTVLTSSLLSRNAIRKFCNDNGYDYEKLMKLVISMGQNFIAFVGFDHDTDGDCGLQKDVSGNIVLIVEKKTIN